VTDPIDALDEWLRRDIVRINTELEEGYFAERVDVLSGRPHLETLRLALLQQGGALMERLACMPALPEDARARYRLLGLIGHYLAACQRHEARLSDTKGGRQAAWRLSQRIGISRRRPPLCLRAISTSDHISRRIASVTWTIAGRTPATSRPSTRST